MPDLQFSCESCHQPLSISREFSGARVECPACRSLTAAPGLRMGTLGNGAPDETLRAPALEIGIKFPCVHCEEKLVADFDLLGRLIDCPACRRMIQVPRWSVPDVDLEVSVIPPAPPETLLSPEELAFLSAEGIAG